MAKIKKLFESERNWEKEWKGMPEFSQEDLTSAVSIIVHFANNEDRDKFADIIGQKLTSKTKSIWFPKLEIDKVINKRYVDKGEKIK